MKFEGGVHRVQRVPRTEKQGHIHTSTMTVAILPQPTEINLVINPKDLRIDTKRASGAGGQHVNTTDSAVRIVHLPTGAWFLLQHKNQTLNDVSSEIDLQLPNTYRLLRTVYFQHLIYLDSLAETL